MPFHTAIECMPEHEMPKFSIQTLFFSALAWMKTRSYKWSRTLYMHATCRMKRILSSTQCPIHILIFVHKLIVLKKKELYHSSGKVTTYTSKMIGVPFRSPIACDHQRRNDCKSGGQMKMRGPSVYCSIVIIWLSLSWGSVIAKYSGQGPPAPPILTPMLMTIL